MRHVIAGIIAIVATVLILAILLKAQVRPNCYTLPDFSKYTSVTPTGLAKTSRTHVKVTGQVATVTREADGDLHVGITDALGGRIVAECIPEMPCPAVSVGDRVIVWGISRYDKQHKWYEVHPVEMMQVGK